MGGIPGGPLARLPLQTITMEHEGADEVLRRFVRSDGTRCVANERPVGVGEASSTKDGELFPATHKGIAVVDAGAAIALQNGERAVQTDAEGRAIIRTGANPIAGYVIDAASAAGDKVRCIMP